MLHFFLSVFVSVIDVTGTPYNAGSTNDDTAALRSAILAAQTGPDKTLYIPIVLQIKNHITEPSPSNRLTWYFPRGGGINFNGAPSRRVQFYGDLKTDGLYQIFWNGWQADWYDSTFFAQGTKPEWFGAKRDGVTDDYDAIWTANELWAGGVLEFAQGVYAVSGGAGASLFNVRARHVRGVKAHRLNEGGTIIKVVGANVVDKVLWSQSSRMVIENVTVLANAKANYGIHLWTSHLATLDTVSVQGALLAGIKTDLSQIMSWRDVWASNNIGRGFWIKDANGSRFSNMQANMNGTEGFYAEAVDASGGFSLAGMDLEWNCMTGGVADFHAKGIASASEVTGLWIESNYDRDSIVLDGARHMIMVGSRVTGASTVGGNRGVRLINGAMDNSFFGLRVIQGPGPAGYETVELGPGCHDNTFSGSRRMSQSAWAGETLNYNNQGIGNTTEPVADLYGTAPPATGFHKRGMKMWNTEPSPGGTPGWVCVVAGDPGTWAQMPTLGCGCAL